MRIIQVISLAKTKKAWHDTEDLGRKLKRVFNRLDKQSESVTEISELTSVANSMAHTAMQIINIKRQTHTESRLERVEQIMEYIPKEIIADAMVKISAQK